MVRPFVTGERPLTAGACAPSFRSVNNVALWDVSHEIRQEAARQRQTFGNEPSARALEWAAERIDEALREGGEKIVELPEAALISGYCEDHLARLVRQGRIPDLRPPGYLGRIRIRVADLPLKPARQHISNADDTHSPAASHEARTA